MLDIPIVQGFATLFSGWAPVFFALLGTCIGLMAGALPGLSASAAIALLIPLTFYMDTVSALVVTLFPDSGERYLSKLNEEWMRHHELI